MAGDCVCAKLVRGGRICAQLWWFCIENRAVWVAQALNVDVSPFGDTLEEARSAIQEALELYFEDAPDA